jgi:hypothetical protein
MLSARVRALLAAARYPLTDIAVYPRDFALTADVQEKTINVRAEMDRSAASAGFQFDVSPRSELRLREWPLAPTGTQIQVVDCPTAGAVLSPSIGFTVDDDELLNVVIVSNNTVPPTVAKAEDAYSLGAYGPFSEAMGFPRTDLAFADQLAAVDWCHRVADRYALAISRANDIDADAAVDPGWVPLLAALDTGQAIRVTRTELDPFSLDGVVVGFEHRLIPDQWVATLHTDTITKTF